MTGFAEALSSDLARLGRAYRECGIKPMADYLPQLAAAFAVEYARVLDQATDRRELTP